MKKKIKRKRETSNNHRSQVQQENSHHPIDKNDKLTQEKVIKDIRLKEREHSY